MPPADESEFLDLASPNRNALLGATLVGVAFGLAPLIALVVELTAGNGAPVGAVIAVIVICGALAFMGIACGNAWLKVVRRGSDWLVVEAAGLRRECRVGGFAVTWPELAGIEVVATDGIPGDNPYRAYDNPRRRAGTLTALRLYPNDPAAFGAQHAPLVVEQAPALSRRILGTPFGLVVAMQAPQREQLAAALGRFAGPAFRGVRDETTAGRRAAQR